MRFLVCIVLGYVLGCINPSYLISKIKNKDIRESGTGNLGATNTFINFGRGWGIRPSFADWILIYDFIDYILN